MLNQESSIPLYRQLFSILKKRIHESEFGPGRSIPSERALCDEYGVSRTTVRQALQELINEGLLYKKQGKGTFEAKKKFNQGLVRFINFERTVLELGMKPSTRILCSEALPADIHIAKILDIPPIGRILKLSLLGLGDDEPLVLYESSFSLSVGKDIAAAAEAFEKKGLPFSTYDLYEKVGTELPKFVDQTLEAATADDRIATIMDIPRGAAVFMVTSIFQGADHRPLELRVARYRGDRYKFHIRREYK